jgi:hypothetical protein
LFFKDHLDVDQWVMYSLFGINTWIHVQQRDPEKERERRRGRRTIRLGGAAGVGEGEAMVARTSGSMQRR